MQMRKVNNQHDTDALTLFDVLDGRRGKFDVDYSAHNPARQLKLRAKVMRWPLPGQQCIIACEVDISYARQEQRFRVQLNPVKNSRPLKYIVLNVADDVLRTEHMPQHRFVLAKGTCLALVQQICLRMDFMQYTVTLELQMQPEYIACLAQRENHLELCTFGRANDSAVKRKLQLILGEPESTPHVSFCIDCVPFGGDTDSSVPVLCLMLQQQPALTPPNVCQDKLVAAAKTCDAQPSNALELICQLVKEQLSMSKTAEHINAPQLGTLTSSSTSQDSSSLTPTPAARRSSSPAQTPVNAEFVPEASRAPESRPKTPMAAHTANDFETVKTNLKNFLKHWEQHANSSYSNAGESEVNATARSPTCGQPFKLPPDAEEVFCPNDVHFIMLARLINDSRDTLAGTQNATAQFMPPHGNMKRLLQKFERRNAHTNYVNGARRAAQWETKAGDGLHQLSDALLLLPSGDGQNDATQVMFKNVRVLHDEPSANDSHMWQESARSAGDQFTDWNTRTRCHVNSKLISNASTTTMSPLNAFLKRRAQGANGQNFQRLRAFFDK